MKTSLNKLILLAFILIFGIVLFSEYNANETKKKLDVIEKELDEKMPIEPVGEVLIIATQAKTSTALITRSRFELRRGDEVLMLRNY